MLIVYKSDISIISIIVRYGLPSWADLAGGRRSGLMAGQSCDEYAISIRYGAKNKPFRFSGNELVSFVIKKAASDLQISFDERPKLILVHMGTALPRDSSLKVIDDR